MLSINQLLLSFTIAIIGFTNTFVLAAENASEPFILKPNNVDDISKILDSLQQTIDVPRLQFPNSTNGSFAVSVSNSAKFDLSGIKEAVSLQITKDGYLVTESVNGGIKYATIASAIANSNPLILLTPDVSYATPGFSLSGGHLALNGTDSWLLSVNSTDISFKLPGAPLSGNETVNIPLKLNAISKDSGSAVSDFSPSLTVTSGADIYKRYYVNSTVPAYNQTSYNSSSAAITTVTFETTVVEAQTEELEKRENTQAVSQIGDGQVQAATSAPAESATTSSAPSQSTTNTVSTYEGAGVKNSAYSGTTGFALLCIFASVFA